MSDDKSTEFFDALSVILLDVWCPACSGVDHLSRPSSCKHIAFTRYDVQCLDCGNHWLSMDTVYNILTEMGRLPGGQD